MCRPGVSIEDFEDLPSCLSATFGAAHDTKNTIGCCVIHAVIRPLGDVEIPQALSLARQAFGTVFGQHEDKQGTSRCCSPNAAWRQGRKIDHHWREQWLAHAMATGELLGVRRDRPAKRSAHQGQGEAQSVAGTDIAPRTVENPHRVLRVSRDASLDEIKRQKKLLEYALPLALRNCFVPCSLPSPRGPAAQ